MEGSALFFVPGKLICSAPLHKAEGPPTEPGLTETHHSHRGCGPPPPARTNQPSKQIYLTHPPTTSRAHTHTQSTNTSIFASSLPRFLPRVSCFLPRHHMRGGLFRLWNVQSRSPFLTSFYENELCTGKGGRTDDDVGAAIEGFYVAFLYRIKFGQFIICLFVFFYVASVGVTPSHPDPQHSLPPPLLHVFPKSKHR